MKRLNENEMKKLTGGNAPRRGKMFCECLGSGNAHDVVACSYDSVGGGFNCLGLSSAYCQNTYGSNAMECSGSFGA